MTVSSSNLAAHGTLDRVAPLLFAVLWSTGWIAAKFGAMVSGPLTFLTLRYLIATVLFFGFCWFARIAIPRDRTTVINGLISGALLHGLYLSAIWWAISDGVPAGLSAIIAALQPLLTALSAPFIINERLNAVQKSGIVLGFIGVAGAVLPKLFAVDVGNLSLFAIMINILGMVSVTAGTLFQKRFLSTGDLRAIAALQFVGALLVTAPLALIFEPQGFTNFTPSWGFAAVMTWSVLGNSVASVLLLLHLLRHGQASRAASLIYLVPPFAAVQAMLLFDEWPTAYTLAGMAVAAIGVYLVNRKATPK
jgi:drug/metabolite transporter (DMT)-like permease